MDMSDLFSSLLIFTIIKTILNTFFFTVSKFYKNLVKWTLTEMKCSVAGTKTLDRECYIMYVYTIRFSNDLNINDSFHLKDLEISKY
jgi:hypothetical protein